MAADDEDENEVVEELKNLSEAFHLSVCEFPTQTNRIKNVLALSPHLVPYVARCAKKTRILVHSKVYAFIGDFLKYKRKLGTKMEKELYRGMDTNTLILRLVSKRPLFFFGRSDCSLLRNGKTPSSLDWKELGKGECGINLKEYISYDEMQISALIGVSSPTVFINSGSRDNCAHQGIEGTFERTGVYVGLVGARFEKEDKMETTHVLVRKDYHVNENGYGAEGQSGKRQPQLLAIWAKLYGLKQENGSHYFNSYDEIKWGKKKYHQLRRNGPFFRTDIFAKRMRFTVEPYLIDANMRGAEEARQVYVFVVGLGLGVWAVDSKHQGKVLVSVFHDVLCEVSLPYISVIDFSWFPDSVTTCGGVPNGHVMHTPCDNEVSIRFTKRNPADLLGEEDQGKLVVACYAWDGNSFPGNEYWRGMLAASGDPAAACCSIIPEIQNAYINPTLQSKNSITPLP